MIARTVAGAGAVSLVVACGAPEAPPRAPELARYALVVTTVSIGQGTDPDARRKFETILDRFERDNGVRLSVRSADWGKEGEEDYCYPLSEVPPAKAKALVQELRASFAGNEMLTIAEDAPCRESKNR